MVGDAARADGVLWGPGSDVHSFPPVQVGKSFGCQQAASALQQQLAVLSAEPVNSASVCA